MNNLTLKKEDFEVNPDGSIDIVNPELNAKIEKASAEPVEADIKNIEACNNCYGGCK